MTNGKHCFFTLALLLTFTLSISTANAGSLSVAVAANFHPVLIQIADSFQVHTGHRLLISSASTGNLLSQLLNGAPYDLFMAADTTAIHTLTRKKIVDPATVTTYAYGKLVAAGSCVDSTMSLADALAKVHRIALAQPEVAPYGKAAQQVLEALGLWKPLQKRLVYARSVGQCFQFAVTENVPLAFVAYSTLISSGKPFTGVWVIDTALYAPIEQRMAVIARSAGAPIATEFIQFMHSPPIVTHIRAFGYNVPGEV